MEAECPTFEEKLSVSVENNEGLQDSQKIKGDDSPGDAEVTPDKQCPADLVEEMEKTASGENTDGTAEERNLSVVQAMGTIENEDSSQGIDHNVVNKKGNNETVENENSEPDVPTPEVADYPPEYARFYGHKFDKNFELRDMNGDKFKFNFYNQHILDQERYMDIGEAMNEFIYELMQKRCGMKRHAIPFDASPNEARGFFFASENAMNTEDKLLILIHGSGVVRAGQWARRIIINDNLFDGSQIPYIEQAYKEKYEVIVLNTNQNYAKNGPIRGSESPEKHALYVWDTFIMEQIKARHIAIMAHSYGGCVTLSLANRRKESFLEKVFAVGFSDSVHSMGPNVDKRVRQFFRKHARNWVTSSDDLDVPQSRGLCGWSGFVKDVPEVSAGDTRHEWTSTTCKESVFGFFEFQLEKLRHPETGNNGVSSEDGDGTGVDREEDHNVRHPEGADFNQIDFQGLHVRNEDGTDGGAERGTDDSKDGIDLKSDGEFETAVQVEAPVEESTESGDVEAVGDN